MGSWQIAYIKLSFQPLIQWELFQYYPLFKIAMSYCLMLALWKPVTSNEYAIGSQQSGKRCKKVVIVTGNAQAINLANIWSRKRDIIREGSLKMQPGVRNIRSGSPHKGLKSGNLIVRIWHPKMMGFPFIKDLIFNRAMLASQRPLRFLFKFVFSRKHGRLDTRASVSPNSLSEQPLSKANTNS